MARKLYDLAVKTGEYQDREGNKKGRWQNVGAVMQGDDGGKFVMLAKWFNPAGVPDLSGKGGESILLSMFEPRQSDGEPRQQQNQPRQGGQRTQQQPRQQPQQQDHDSFDDDIPF